MDTLSFKAFNHTLFAICYLVTLAAVLAYNSKYSEAIGVGAAVTGLIGLIRFPSSKQVTVDNGTANPIPTQPADAEDKSNG